MRGVLKLAERQTNKHITRESDDSHLADRLTSGSDHSDTQAEIAKFEPVFHKIFNIEKVHRPKPAFDYKNT